MAEEEEDFSKLPFPDRFAHKNWKVRKQGYEDAAKAFEITPGESDPIFKQFLLDSGLWKGAVLDSNVAAQQEGVNSLCAFLKYGGPQAAIRSRSQTITPLIEKGLSSTKAATKQSSVEAILLYVEMDKADPILDDILAGLSNKLPKIVAATLNTMTALYHAYGVKIVEAKPALKALPKAFSHADKNVRAEASALAVELYRWLREAMKPLFWDELKPVQQQDLEKAFEKVKSEPPAKQDRLQRSQQAAAEKKVAAAQEQPEEGEDEEAEAEEADVRDLSEPVDVANKMPANFDENMASSKWKDRKDALDALYAVANTPNIKDGHYDEVTSILAKCMKDANVQVVSTAAQCLEVLSKGLHRGFAKYRSRTMPPVLERLKDKKLADPLGSALDSMVSSTSLSESLEDILEFLKHKNPQVKAETLKLLIRCLKNTREAPNKEETKSIAGVATKLLTESTEATRSGGAELLGTLMKIMGERAMNPYMESIDNIRKEKIKEYFDAAVVKAKDKPKPPPAQKAAPPPQKRPATKKPASGLKPPAKRASTPTIEKPPASPLPTKSAAPKSKIGGLPKPGLKAPGSRLPGAGGVPAPKITSPRRTITPHSEDDTAAPPPASKLGGPRGLANRPLGKPAALPSSPPPSSQHPSISAADLAELEDLRAERNTHARIIEDLRSEKSRLLAQVNELQNHEAQLIEDHTRDVLSIKAKETQLVRARSDAEAAESSSQRYQRENERLKRELARAVRSSGSIGDDEHIFRDASRPGGLERADSSRSGQAGRIGRSFGSPSEEKENKDLEDGLDGGRQAIGEEKGTGSGKPPENWKRAAEVTSQLKARIEMMKKQQGMARQR